MKNTENINDTSFKISEVILSFLLVIAVGSSFSITHQYTATAKDSISSLSYLPRMRGKPRQHIQVGVPDVWLNVFTETLNNKGGEVKVSRIMNAWLIDVVINKSLSYEDNKTLKIFLERYGVNTKNMKEFHLTITGFNTL